MKRILSLIMMVLLALGVLSLGGCGASTSTPTPKEAYAEQISFFQWTEYTPQSVLDSFRRSGMSCAYVPEREGKKSFKPGSTQ